MGYKIIWSEKALLHVENTIEYLHEEWSQTAVNNFYEKLAKTLSTIEAMPNSGKKYPDSDTIKSIGISKLVALYYEIDKDSIEILSLFDNRRNPKRSKF